MSYRAVSLLLCRPPGREVTPATSSTYTARWSCCAKLSDALGGGSMTGPADHETKANDVSAHT